MQLAVNSEHITSVATFPNCTDSGTVIPFLNHILRMQDRNYQDIVADAGYENVSNYLYLRMYKQSGYIKPRLQTMKLEKQESKATRRMENI